MSHAKDTVTLKTNKSNNVNWHKYIMITYNKPYYNTKYGHQGLKTSNL